MSMDRVLTVVGAFCAGVLAHRWLRRKWHEELGAVRPYAVAAPRLAAVECRCSECAPPFLQESPAEVQ
jgi:hypothetical protein